MGKYSSRILDGLQETETDENSAISPVQAPAASKSYSERILGTQETGQTKQPAALAQDKTQEEGWGEWIVNNVRGRQDPAYSGIGSIYDQFTDELRAPTGDAAVAGASDAQMSDIVKSTLGEKVKRIEKDSMGRDVFVTIGKDGQEQKGYLNTPGLDSTDVFRGVYGAIPYIASSTVAGKLMKGAGLVTQAIGQGLTAGATSAAGDLAQIPMGSKQGVELDKAGMMTAFGTAGPAVSAAGSALWRRIVTVPGLFNRSTGQLTEKGLKVAQDAGLDPADLTPDMAKTFADSYAKSGDAALAASKTATEPLGIPATRGQVTKRPFLLNQEEKMRRGLYGPKAEREMLANDALQRRRLEDAAFGGHEKAPGVGNILNPGRGGHANAKVLGENVQDTLSTAREAARKQEGALWETNGVKSLTATEEALSTLQDDIGRALAKTETSFSPTGKRMAEEIGKFVSDDLPVNEAGGISLPAVKSVDSMRRHLGSLVDSAEIGTDKRQAGIIYDAFNDWIAESAKKSLLAGDPKAAAQLISARAFTKEVRKMFLEGGKAGPAGAKLSQALGKADSGEAVLQSILGSRGTSTPPAGTVAVLKRIKTALDRFGGDGAAQAWNDIKLAHWMRVVTGKNGELLGPQALTNNIKAAFTNQRSVTDVLYSKEELAAIRRLWRAAEVTAYKPPNASGSGYTVAEAIQEMFGKLLDIVPGSKAIKAGIEYSGVPDAINAVRARSATSAPVRATRRNLTPFLTGVGSTMDNE